VEGGETVLGHRLKGQQNEHFKQKKKNDFPRSTVFELLFQNRREFSKFVTSATGAKKKKPLSDKITTLYNTNRDNFRSCELFHRSRQEPNNILLEKLRVATHFSPKNPIPKHANPNYGLLI